MFPVFFASCSKSAAFHMQLLESQVLWFVTVPPTLSWLPCLTLAAPQLLQHKGPPAPPKPPSCPLQRKGLPRELLQQFPPLCSVLVYGLKGCMSSSPHTPQNPAAFPRLQSSHTGARQPRRGFLPLTLEEMPEQLSAAIPEHFSVSEDQPSAAHLLEQRGDDS